MSLPRTPGHRQRTVAGQPHPPARKEPGLRPGRLPHRLRQPTGHLPQGQVSTGWHGPYPTSSPAAAPADRGPVQQEPVPPLPRPHPVHHHRRQRPDRGLSPTRTPRPATPRPRRAADTRLEDPLRGPLWSRGHHQRVRPRTRHAPLPLPRTAENPPATRTHGHRREHRTPQQPVSDRRTLSTETADRLPDLPGPERHPPLKVLANPRHLSPTIQDPRQSQVRRQGGSRRPARHRQAAARRRCVRVRGS